MLYNTLSTECVSTIIQMQWYSIFIFENPQKKISFPFRLLRLYIHLYMYIIASLYAQTSVTRNPMLKEHDLSHPALYCIYEVNLQLPKANWDSSKPGDLGSHGNCNFVFGVMFLHTLNVTAGTRLYKKILNLLQTQNAVTWNEPSASSVKSNKNFYFNNSNRKSPLLLCVNWQCTETQHFTRWWMLLLAKATH